MNRHGLWALRRKSDGGLLGLLLKPDDEVGLAVAKGAGLKVKEVRWAPDQWMLEPSPKPEARS